MEKTISYTRQEHIITRQARAEEALLSQLDAGDYTPEHPLVQLNSYFFAPLCALVLFHTVTPVSYTHLDVYKRQSIPRAPSGAVRRMERTATERTMLPQGSPRARGTEPMAACTVALGR